MIKQPHRKLSSAGESEFFGRAIAFFKPHVLNGMMELANAAGTFCCRLSSSHLGFFLPMPKAALPFK